MILKAPKQYHYAFKQNMIYRMKIKKKFEFFNPLHVRRNANSKPQNRRKNRYRIMEADYNIIMEIILKFKIFKNVYISLFGLIGKLNIKF